VHVEELGETPDGQHFLVMEYVHGCSLSQLLNKLAKKNRGLPPELAVFVAMQIAAGLHAAHEVRDDQGRPLGVVHRDVSPDNVLLAYEGHVKLIDFGVAKVDTVNRTSTGTLKGKLRYMSPEQASGREIDRRTDVYALAIVLWEMLTTRRLFAETDQLLLLDLVRNPTVVPAGSIRPGIPPALDAVLMKALSRDPAARHASTHELRRALAEAMPSANLVDASQLGALLSVAMSSEIENELRRLPTSVSGLSAPPRPSSLPDDVDAALATMTITVEGLSLSDARSQPGGSQPSQPSVSGARAIAPGSSPMIASPPPSVPPAWQPPAVVAPSSDAPETPRSSGAARWIALAAVVVSLGGLGLGALVWSRGESEVRVTQLPLAPDAIPSAPAPAAPAPAVPVPAVPVPAVPVPAVPVPALGLEPQPTSAPAVVGDSSDPRTAADAPEAAGSEATHAAQHPGTSSPQRRAAPEATSMRTERRARPLATEF
jgi:serine/threonine protein kinase